MYLFVALCVWMCVAGSNKAEGTMLGTNEILASKHDIAVLEVEQGQFEFNLAIANSTLYENYIPPAFK